MNLINNTLKNFLKLHEIDNPDFVYLVAFSGGYDSMCLLNSLKHICSNKIVAIHLNHNWRGDESDNEELNCINFCKKIGVEFYSEKLSDNVEKNETSARDERYKFFERCSQKFGSKIIFTAHNKNDNAETVLYRISKGTGITGLQGISDVRDIYYRPLLSVERKDIEKYCQDNDLKPNYDSSNDDLIHKRNLLRQNVLPQLAKINPEIVCSLDRLSRSAKESNEIIGEYISLIKNKICKNNNYDTGEFIKLSTALKYRLLYELVSPLVPQNYDRERFLVLYNFIEENATSKFGKVCSVTYGYDLYVSEKYFTLIKKSEGINEVLKIIKCGSYSFGNMYFEIQECSDICERYNIDNKIVYADLSEFNSGLELRTRRDGDVIQPFGMSGHQKLKKYLNSKKIPNYEKDKLIMLATGNEILWICGVGTSEKIRVKTKPTHKLEVKE